MLNKNFTGKDYIISYNMFWEVDEEDTPFLNQQEFYLYATLYTKRMMDYSISTNVNLIVNWLVIPFDNSVSRNKATIREVLRSLIAKRVFQVENGVDINKLTFDTQIELMLHERLYEDHKGKVNGFEKVPYKKVNELNKNIRHLYMYAATKRFTSYGGFKCSYGRWADILGCHPSTAKRYVKDALENKVIYVSIGNYRKGSKLQDVNTYDVVPFTRIEHSYTNNNIKPMNSRTPL